MNTPVSIIIPVYNKWELTKGCLESIAEHTRGYPLEVVVVDNASTDATALEAPELGRALFGETFVYLRHSENKNFSGACNSGARAATSELLLFLNNDTIVTPGWLPPLVKTLLTTDKKVGAVGPLLLYPEFGGKKDRVQHAGITISPAMHLLHLYEGIPADHPAVNYLRVVQAITAAAFLIRKALFWEFEGFYEGFRNGFEDVDLCARLWEQNYVFLVQPESRVYHLQGQTPGRHAHETENADLIANRSFQLLGPDYHVHLERDGYELALSRWLAFYPELPDAKRELFKARFLREGNEEMVDSLLDAEPFWNDGYEWLAQRWERQGKLEEAFFCRLRAVRCKMDPDTLLPLFSLTRRLGIPEIQYAMNGLDKFTFSFHFFMQTAHSLRRHYAAYGLDTVVRQCDAWLEGAEEFRMQVLRPAIFALKQEGLLLRSLGNRSDASYICSVELQSAEPDALARAAERMVAALPAQPLLSLLMPVYNPVPRYLDEALRSVREQIYPSWELCIADDASTDPRVREVLEFHAKADPRIRIHWRQENGHICAASNSALAMVQGEYTVLMDHDDLLRVDALAWVAHTLDKHPQALLLYSDEDKFSSENGRCQAYLKPDFDPDLLCGQNYFSHLGVYSTQLVKDVGGFRPGFEGSQDHDLLLRCVEKVKHDQIVHIPEVLYHWRIHEESTAASGNNKPYAVKSGVRAVQEHLDRIGRKALVQEHESFALYEVYDQMPEPAPLVSLLIDATGQSPAKCGESLRALLAATAYPNLELVLVAGQTGVLPDLDCRVQILSLDEESSDSRRIGYALQKARGEYAGYLRFGLQPSSPQWLSELVSQAARPEVGVIGPRICSPGGTFHNAGYGITKDGLVFPSFRGVFMREDPAYYGQPLMRRSVLAVPEQCCLSRVEVFRAAFDPETETLWCLDYCLRLAEQGFRVLCSPHADMYEEHFSPCSLREDDPLLDRFLERWHKQLYASTLHGELAPVPGGYTMARINKL